MAKINRKVQRRRRLRTAKEWAMDAIRATASLEGAKEFLLAKQKEAEDQVTFSPAVWMALIELALRLLPLLFELKTTFGTVNKIKWVLLCERLTQEIMFNCEQDLEVAQEAMGEAEMRSQSKESAIYAYVIQNWATFEGE